MPPLKRRSKGSQVSTRLSIPSLSGGVGRQAPSKRTPFEAENIDNCLVSVERSIEKRSGFEVLEKTDFTRFHAQETNEGSIDNLFYYWLNIDKNNRFVIIIDYAARFATQKLFSVYRVIDNMWEDVTPVNQWDPLDPLLAWDGTETIESYDPRFIIYNTALTLGQVVSLQADYASVLSQGVVKMETRKYITFGSALEDTNKEVYTPKVALRIVSLGTNTLILNTLVYAGFSSNEAGYKLDLNGYVTGTIDTKGRKVTYYTAATIRKTNLGRLFPSTTSTFPAGESFDAAFAAKYIPVEDYVYGEIDRAWLGQSLSDFSEIRFPPDENDWYGNNGDSNQSPIDNSANLMLQALYDEDHPHVNATYPVQGRGKVYYCAGPYLSQASGYYRIINFPQTESYDPDPANAPGPVVGTGRPYTQQVRTPDSFSYLDPARMPQNLLFTSSTGWQMEPIDWEARTTGNRYTNPGPSPFLSTDKKTVRPARINSLAVFRDRLFFSIGDVVFSSQLGNFQNFWINDPTAVSVADPIDIRASLNQYAEITSLTPFDEFLFINTKGNVQFELKGSQNIISPLTAEISPTTFYATAPLIEPVLIGSQVYFFDARRLYIYFSQKVRGLNTAIEVSSTCPDYLPVNYGATCTAVAQDTILTVDEANKNHIYLYTNRYSGERVLQSAFYRFLLHPSDQVQSMQSYENYLYCVIYRESENRLYLTRCYLKPDLFTVPRLDFFRKVVVPEGLPSSLTQYFNQPYGLPYESVYMILGEDFGDLQGSAFKATVSLSDANTSLIFTGIDLSQYAGKSVYIGGSFEMNIELSEQFLRDQDSNSVAGVLNLRTLVTRHTNSGDYRVVSERRGRAEQLVSEFSFNRLDKVNEAYETNGEFVSKIFGFADSTKIFIQSDSPSPCNIVQMELKGKFKQTYTSLR